MTQFRKSIRRLGKNAKLITPTILKMMPNFWMVMHIVSRALKAKKSPDYLDVWIYKDFNALQPKFSYDY